MPKNLVAANRFRMWIFGRSIDFNVVTTTLHLGPADYATAGGAPRRAPKRQITLHCTAGRGSADDVISWWNNPASGAAGAHWVVERTGTAQIARPAAHAGGELRDDRSFLDPGDAATRLVDTVRVADDDMIVYHGGDVNRNSIGIEIVNIGDGWYMPTVADEPSLAGRHHPIATCPGPINIAPPGSPPNLKCNHGRPQDLNHFVQERVHLNSDFQAFQDEQYSALILLLRHLCITHRIPKQFLGHSTDEVFRHWLHEPAGDPAMRRVNRRSIFNFRGIYHHRNCHANKPCPGVLHRCRLYRGISDEWWLPISLDGTPRDYYSGPFENPAWAAGRPTRPAFFRPRAGGHMEATVYRDADIDALSESRSYYDLDRIDQYYAAVETGRGGLFPVGLNKVWHGGVHFQAGASDWVYAAASGTIVAARVSSHAATERERNFGSQRFVLIKHAVHLTTEADPGGFGQRINYTADPVFIFTLYMHLAPLASEAAEHDDNPPWFNAWRRRNAGVAVGMTADGERGRVFAPDVAVMVGDVLGHAGTFRGERLVHFEVIGHRTRELRMAPWDQADRRVEDNNRNVICDVPTLDRFLTDRMGDGLDVIDLLAAAPRLRTVKALHLSEWALSEPAQIDPLIAHPDRRTALWPHFSRFSWVAEAARASADVRDHLGSDGMFWHYHPVTFMQHVNQLVLGENREIPEGNDHAVNVLVSEDYYLTDFVSWNAGTVTFDPAAADAADLVPQDGQVFNFSRRSVCCREPGGTHAAPYDTSNRTHLALALMEVLQKIREHFDNPIDIRHALVCWNHAHRRVTGRGPHLEEFQLVNALGLHPHSAGEIESHEHGTAVDFAPFAAPLVGVAPAVAPVDCRNLWLSTTTIVDLVNRVYSDSCGMPTAANMPEGYQAVAFRAHPHSADTKLRALPMQVLTADEARDFEIHLALVEAPHYDAPRVQLTVQFEKLEILDDQDTFCAGEWELYADINGQRLATFDRSVKTGDRITLSPAATWCSTFSLNPVWGELLRIRVSGREIDVFDDDTLGTASAEFGEASTPAWGVGRHTVESSNHSFRLTFRIDRV